MRCSPSTRSTPTSSARPSPNCPPGWRPGRAWAWWRWRTSTATAAALSTADGLLLTIANALSHDVYYRMIDPRASAGRRLAISKSLLLGVAVVAAWVASLRPDTILSMVAWAFSIAGACFFPALVLGIFWRRATRQGAVAGMLTGLGVTLYYLVGVKFLGMEKWWGIGD
ncbi:MAG: hypothetical protein MUE86_00605, partial [Thiobacillaceae bacterium]|nr:hypothetical protein [Thiobacillaceae bacterium]